MTKVSAKLRPIVSNPAFTGKGAKTRKNDARRARFGVYRFDRQGNKKFVPIFKGGEFGASVKYISKTEVLVKVGRKSSRTIRAANKALKLVGSKKRFGSVGIWQKFPAGSSEFEMKGIKESPRRIIRNRRLAKRSWMWPLKGFSKDRITGVADIQPILSAVQCGLVLTNRIDYLSKVTPANLVEEAARRATDSIMHQAAMQAEKKFSTDIPLRSSERKRSVIKRLEVEFAKSAKRGVTA